MKALIPTPDRAGETVFKGIMDTCFEWKTHSEVLFVVAILPAAFAAAMLSISAASLSALLWIVYGPIHALVDAIVTDTKRYKEYKIRTRKRELAVGQLSDPTTFTAKYPKDPQ